MSKTVCRVVNQPPTFLFSFFFVSQHVIHCSPCLKSKAKGVRGAWSTKASPFIFPFCLTFTQGMSPTKKEKGILGRSVDPPTSKLCRFWWKYFLKFLFGKGNGLLKKQKWKIKKEMQNANAIENINMRYYWFTLWRGLDVLISYIRTYPLSSMLGASVGPRGGHTWLDKTCSSPSSMLLKSSFKNIVP